MDEEKDAAKDAAALGEEKDDGKENEATCLKKIGKIHGTTMMMATEIMDKTTPMISGAEVEEKVEKAKARALEEKAKE